MLQKSSESLKVVLLLPASMISELVHTAAKPDLKPLYRLSKAKKEKHQLPGVGGSVSNMKLCITTSLQVVQKRQTWKEGPNSSLAFVTSPLLHVKGSQ